MSVVVSMQDVGPCRKQLTVEVPAPAVEAETAARRPGVRAAGRDARLPQGQGARRAGAPPLRQGHRAGGRRAAAAALLAAGAGRERDRAAAAARGRRGAAISRPARPSPSSPRSRRGRRSSCATSATSTCRTPRSSRAPWRSTTADRRSAQAPRRLGAGRAAGGARRPGDRRDHRAASPAAKSDQTRRDAADVEFEVGDPRVWEELSLAALRPRRRPGGDLQRTPRGRAATGGPRAALPRAR